MDPQTSQTVSQARIFFRIMAVFKQRTKFGQRSTSNFSQRPKLLPNGNGLKPCSERWEINTMLKLQKTSKLLQEKLLLFTKGEIFIEVLEQNPPPVWTLDYGLLLLRIKPSLSFVVPYLWWSPPRPPPVWRSVEAASCNGRKREEIIVTVVDDDNCTKSRAAATK